MVFVDGLVSFSTADHADHADACRDHEDRVGVSWRVDPLARGAMTGWL